ncbi:MAG TPA: hypothetical protein PL193_11855 [Xanthobacteraceae bacterium]|nr:hypothetical protein [Xanthobacteraceae bacterium]
MKAASARTTLLAAAMLLAASHASAQQFQSPLPEHMPLGKEVCYGRVYDASHLAKHPKQLVTSLHVFRDLDPDQNTEDTPQTREEVLKNDGEGGVNVSAFVRFKNRKGVFWNGLTCNKSADGKFVRCGIDCDGGSFELRTRGKNLHLTNEGFVLIGGCGASEEEYENQLSFLPGADDKTFLLEPLPLAQCAALRDQVKPAFAKMGKALRTRFETQEAVCYSRIYDDAHLKKNPQQTVRKIALLRAAGGKDVHKDAPGYDLTFRIETKDGKQFTQTAKCYPDRYTYTCPVKAEIDTAKDFYVTRAGDNALTIRDRAGKFTDFFGVKLGKDDRLFRLEASAPAACALN